ncbi:MBL fold metallo-hydrolase [Candidatus Vondammii sp. HM_W22]|uniref:MBL fold metallo-hydrolase n=1 Tax=Candidatus Vondammii sp. HM_W22 TaxID=2687299 RepID=UPI002E7ADFC3|nr:MBL fold metallo-hydrolase [Candidatus Vondammii sp. HM_W22]
MRFASLGSGSRGNATLVEGGGTRLLLDNGFAAREVTRRLELLDVAADTLDGILVTHEHQDHIRGVGALARRYQIPVWITHGTHRLDRCGQLPDLRLIHSHQDAFTVGGLTVQPYPVPHDAREPIQFVFQDKTSKLGILTDAGRVTPHILEMLVGCDALLLECNHDLEMLAQGPYPLSLQRRVGGELGHLSNLQAAELLAQLDHGRLQHLLIAHLSEKNNRFQCVLDTLMSKVPELEERLRFTSQGQVTGWFEI